MGTRIILLFMVLATTGCYVKGCSASPKQPTNRSSEIFVTQYGVTGDGTRDDTHSLQAALTKCSTDNLTCIVPSGKKVRITAPVFMWGNSGLVGERGAEILIKFSDLTDRYVINLGLSAKQRPEKPFTGRIENLKFRAISGPLDKWLKDGTTISGRIVQVWRTRNASISNNIFDLGVYHYAATAGHNNNRWLHGLGIREHLMISGNTVNARAGAHGMEGIGINYAHDVTIKNNRIYGVGDDVIGVHFCDDVKIVGNTAEGVDGRIYVSNSTNVLIESNQIARATSPLDGKFKKGTALIYIGYEYPARVRKPKPAETSILNNTLTYPIGAIDGGAAINVRGAASTIIKGNVLINNSPLVTGYGIWVAPWEDPSVRDNVVNQKMYPIVNAQIKNNRLIGTHPLKIVQTGRCIGYKGKVDIISNQAKIGKLSCSKVVNQ